MAGRRELGFPKSGSCSLKEQLARKTLRNVRSQGHTCVELREDGKRLVFFCTLCMAPCYSDSILFDHLKGNLHTERFAAAKATLLKPNPFPFSDGVHFFYDSTEQDEQPPASKAETTRFLDINLDDMDDENLAIVCYDKNLTSNGNEDNSHQQDYLEKNIDSVVDTDHGNSDCAENSDGTENNCVLVIPGVLRKEEVSDLEVRCMGFGQIGARFYEQDGVSKDICRIWCEWLGTEHSGDDSIHMIPEHDFAVVTFTYNYNLGRKGLLDDLKYLLPPSPHSESEEHSGAGNKKRKSFSDPEDVSESLNNQYDSSGEESQSSNNSNSRLQIEGYDDQLMHSRIISSKTMRRELRRQQRVAAERMCDICQHKMLPGKDVATLLNRNTGRLACSSRNLTGAFHVYHISCLIHWILLCELEIFAKKSVASSVKRKSRKKAGAKNNDSGKDSETKAARKQIYSVFCPECQGTGINISGEELERPTVPLSEIFKYKIKANDARRAWMKSPEELQHCSTGFYFPPQTEDVYQENVSSLKLLRFYYAND